MTASRLVAGRGFALLETVIASAIMLAACATLAQLVTLSIERNRNARLTSAATVIAQQKMEQLLGDAAAGAGLNPSTGNTLEADTTGYVDYLDARGRPLAAASGPLDAVYIRRWMIEPLPADPSSTMAIQVLVTRHGSSASADARLVAVKTRKAD